MTHRFIDKAMVKMDWKNATKGGLTGRKWFNGKKQGEEDYSCWSLIF